MSYAFAWIVVVIATGVLGFSLYYILRDAIPRKVLIIMIGILSALVMTPAPIPLYSGNYAPAIVVLLFEGLIRSNGQAIISTRLVILTTVVVTIGLLACMRVKSKKSKN